MENKKQHWTNMTAKENLADLLSNMSSDDLQLYNSLRHISTEAAFRNRRFVVVSGNGFDSEPRKRRPVDILTTLEVLHFRADEVYGSTATIWDTQAGKTYSAGHIPVKLRAHPVFMSVTLSQGLVWEARRMQDGSIQRTLVFGMCFKQPSAFDWGNTGKVSVVTQNTYEKAFGPLPEKYTR